jgi:UDP-N-acetylmuramate: L-alanyl-gamma-D-glutamyl-meso-diaminopimelate ligase
MAAAALCSFAGVKRRMECLGQVNGISVYDDFAHHPTAIATTLEGLRARVGTAKIVVLIEPRSNTMRMGIHKEQLGMACVNADDVLWYQPANVNWDLQDVINHSPVAAKLVRSLDDLIDDAVRIAEPGCHIVIMSNGGFGGVHQQLLQRLREVHTGDGAQVDEQRA